MWWNDPVLCVYGQCITDRNWNTLNKATPLYIQAGFNEHQTKALLYKQTENYSTQAENQVYLQTLSFLE